MLDLDDQKCVGVDITNILLEDMSAKQRFCGFIGICVQ